MKVVVRPTTGNDDDARDDEDDHRYYFDDAHDEYYFSKTYSPKKSQGRQKLCALYEILRTAHAEQINRDHSGPKHGDVHRW